MGQYRERKKEVETTPLKIVQEWLDETYEELGMSQARRMQSRITTARYGAAISSSLPQLRQNLAVQWLQMQRSDRVLQHKFRREPHFEFE